MWQNSAGREYPLQDKRRPDIMQLLSRWRVRVSLLSVLIALVLARPNTYSILAGMGFIILGLLWRGWACGHLTKDRELTTSGPYRYTRNPLYLGSLLIAIGVTASSRSWWVAALFVLNFLALYSAAIFREKKAMQELFPDAYSEFSRQVPLFFPSWKPNSQAHSKAFSWARYKVNKEYRALQAAALFLLLLTLRMFL